MKDVRCARTHYTTVACLLSFSIPRALWLPLLSLVDSEPFFCVSFLFVPVVFYVGLHVHMDT